ncbi:MAG: XdhC family protein [Actinomycetota bacterium]|nr:XdhC family protein [Actinomycetota bacterium]
MREEMAARAAELVEARMPFVQATVVRAQHPTSAHAGDTALILEDGRIEGFVGGTCAETSVRVHALDVLRTAEPVLLRILPGTAATTREEGAVTVANPCLSGGTLEIFLEPRSPAPRVLIVGDTPIARALEPAVASLGFVAERTAGDEAVPWPADAALIVASHGRAEEAVLEAALRAGVPYVGLVASRARGGAVLASLDVDEGLRAQVHSPAGLAIGARRPEEIALSIAAELVEHRARRRYAVAPTNAVPAEDGQPAHASEVDPRANGASPVAAVAVDPVCGMSVAVVGDVIRVEHAGEDVYFCCAHCRTTFVDDPVRYATAM